MRYDTVKEIQEAILSALQSVFRGSSLERRKTRTLLIKAYPIRNIIRLDIWKLLNDRKCANESCGNTFQSTRKNKIYCDMLCKHKALQRKYTRAKRGTKPENYRVLILGEK